MAVPPALKARALPHKLVFNPVRFSSFTFVDENDFIHLIAYCDC
jgi:hypothetical protein